MRTLFAIYDQKIPVFIKYSDTILESYNLKFNLMYRAFETSNFKQKWSRHLDDFAHAMFCSVSDLIKLNIFNPYKKIIKLNDLSSNYVAYHIINSFATQKQDYFDEVVFCLWVTGLDETYVMAPETTSDALSVALAMRITKDEDTKNKWMRESQKKKRNLIAEIKRTKKGY